MRWPTVADMAAHAQQLANDHGIIVGNHSRGGSASRHERHANFRPIKSITTYAIAMHEIGHVLGKRQSGRRLEAEAGAWRWAVDNRLRLSLAQADRWDDAMIRSLQSYVDWAKDKRARGVANAPVLPGEDDDLWVLLG